MLQCPICIFLILFQESKHRPCERENLTTVVDCFLSVCHHRSTLRLSVYRSVPVCPRAIPKLASEDHEGRPAGARSFTAWEGSPGKTMSSIMDAVARATQTGKPWIGAGLRARHASVHRSSATDGNWLRRLFQRMPRPLSCCASSVLEASLLALLSVCWAQPACSAVVGR